MSPSSRLLHHYEARGVRRLLPANSFIMRCRLVEEIVNNIKWLLADLQQAPTYNGDGNDAFRVLHTHSDDSLVDSEAILQHCKEILRDPASP